ncbi:hypothetical protein ACQPZQ_33340 [Pseudonocardia sp. CA-142604]|uniref:hypothetical protein n=1 Tax=Pseudonocardia sp. CA-142604 TaxID=3240024 RepID=UPI003D935267
MCDPYSSWSGAPKHWIVIPEQRQESPELASDAHPEAPRHSGRRGELATFAMAAILLALGAADSSATDVDAPPTPAPAP